MRRHGWNPGAVSVLFQYKHTDMTNPKGTCLPLDSHNKCVQLDETKAGGCVAAVMMILRNPILAVTMHLWS